MTAPIITTEQKKTGVILAFAAFFLYSLTSPGNLPGDTEIRWSVAKQIVREHSFSMEDTINTRNYAVGIDGKRYSFYGIGQSIIFLPMVSIGLLMERAGVNSNVADLATQFLTSSILVPLFGAVGVLIFYHIVTLLGYSHKCALFVAGIFGAGTMYWHYSICTQEQGLVTVMFLLAIMLGIKNSAKPQFGYVMEICAILGASLLFRIDAIVMIVPIYLFALISEILQSEEKTKIVCKWLIAGTIEIGTFIVFIGWFNYIRFGNVFENGYSLGTVTALSGHGLFESEPIGTLAAILFSPGKSILLYNPILIMLPWCVYGFWRKNKLLTGAIFCAFAGNLFFYSFYTAWAGDYAWSARFQVPIIGFLTLPLVEIFNKQLKPLKKPIIILLIVLSGIIQLSSVIYNFNLEFVQNPNHCIIPDKYVWDWKQSHLLKRFENISSAISGRKDLSSVAVTNEEPFLLKTNHTKESVRKAYYVNFFPFKARQMLSSGRIFHALLAIWLVEAIILFALLFKFRAIIISTY